MNRASSPGADTVPPLRGLLDLLARGDLAAAAARHASIRRTLLSPMAERRLHRLIDGERPVALHEGTYYVGRADTAQTGVVRTALEFLSSRGASVSRCVVVEFAGDPSQVAAALALDADTVYLCLSGGDADDLVAAAIHEFAHVAFESGIRFLDEGAAHYFESEYRERSLADTEAAPAPAAPAIDARTLLAYEAHDDPYFDLILPGNGLRVHGIGAMFFARLLARLPLPAVQALYRRIREQGAEANGALSIEQTCGISIEEIESGPAAAARTLARAPVIGAAQVAEVESALVAGDLPELTRHYEQLFAHVSTAAAPIARVAPIEALVLASVAMHKSFERVVTRYELAFVRGRLLSHLARSGRDGRYYLLRALMSLTRAAITEGGSLDAALLVDDAKADLELGLARGNTDAVLLTCLAKLEWHFAQAGDDGKRRAIELMSRARADSTHAVHIERILERWKAEAEAATS